MLKSAGLSIVLLLVACLSTGCADNGVFRKAPDYYLAMRQENIAGEIAYLEKKMAENQAGKINGVYPEVYYFLAILYSHYKNPSPDFGRAFSMLERYMTLDADGRKEPEVRYLYALLRKMNSVTASCKQLEQQYAALQLENATLSTELAAAVKENQNMKATLEELMLLDIRIEKKKQTMR